MLSVLCRLVLGGRFVGVHPLPSWLVFCCRSLCLLNMPSGHVFGGRRYGVLTVPIGVLLREQRDNLQHVREGHIRADDDGHRLHRVRGGHVHQQVRHDIPGERDPQPHAAGARRRADRGGRRQRRLWRTVGKWWRWRRRCCISGRHCHPRWVLHCRSRCRGVTCRLARISIEQSRKSFWNIHWYEHTLPLAA